jgi:hypothetical protein
MTSDPFANWERLRNTFENTEAIYIERGALRVRVTNIRANAVVQAISADIEEIPTTGFPGFVDLDRFGLTDQEPLRWTISAGSLTTFSDHTWSFGGEGWSLFFGSELVQEVIRLAAKFSPSESRNERYQRILGWLHCHKLSQGPHVQVFLTGAASRPAATGTATSLREPPGLIAEGILFEDTGHMLRWGTPLTELAGVDSPLVRWRLDTVFLNWPARACLDGLRCDVQTGRSFGPPEPRTYQDYLREFSWVHLEIHVAWSATPARREQGFRELYAHLERAFGPATFSYPRAEGRLPSIHWEFASMNVAFSMLGERPAVYIAHEPEGYPGLRADERAIQAREGRGARVDHVAWPESDGA